MRDEKYYEDRIRELEDQLSGPIYQARVVDLMKRVEEQDKAIELANETYKLTMKDLTLGEQLIASREREREVGNALDSIIKVETFKHLTDFSKWRDMLRIARLTKGRCGCFHCELVNDKYVCKSCGRTKGERQ
jgi:hypothetical protein